MKQKMVKFMSILVVMAIVMIVPTHAVWLRGDYQYSNIGTSYHNLITTKAIPGSGYTLSADTSLTSASGTARINLAYENGESVGIKDFPTQTDVTPLVVSVKQGKKYSFHIKAISGKISGVGRLVTNK